MWNLNGTITTPWFGGDFVREFYQEDRDFLMVLELPDDIEDQVGSGSLIIDLEVDTREEQGWFEDFSIYTFHKTKKTWSEAESHCQKEGGHLASVTSEEVNQVVTNVAGGYDVWLGGKGRKEYGELTWSDKSTSVFTNWGDSSSEGDCVCSHNGKWRAVPCSLDSKFVCQKNNILKGRETMSLTYTQDQLNFPRFLVHYKYKAASQKLLDSWKDKRMTGFRISWRIENENQRLIANISDVGRSIETPHFGDILAETTGAPSDKLYKVTLTPPKDIAQQMTNKRLVINLDINKKPSDEVYAFTSFKLYKDELKSWTDADLHCKREGGQLASIHSLWEQKMAEKAAEGAVVWLGGRKIDGQWQWVDNATWSFENWMSGRPKSMTYLLMVYKGEWFDYESSDANFFLCQGPTVALAKNGLASIEFSKEQLAFFPFHLIFKSHVIDQPIPGEERRTSGFSLNWFLKDSNGTQVTETLPARPEDWKKETPTPSYKEPLLHDMVHLARELRLKNKTHDEILTKVILKKSEKHTMPDDYEMCAMKQIRSGYRRRIFDTVLSNVSTRREGENVLDEDIRTGHDLYHAVVFCSPRRVFYTFIDQLLSVETTRTIIHTTVNLFQSGAITDEKSFTLTSQFYHVLASTLDLHYGNVLLSTSTSAQLNAGIRKKLPFFVNYTDQVEKCLLGSNCDTLQDIYENLGNVNLYFVSKLLFQMPTMSHESCPSTRST